ncbi:MAG: hypothetical protein NTU60_00050 [Candidatus Aminicenantes bacterium]|nr:hypothetical protein [Candidatus Aminicenantes bacterium]
MKERQRAGTAIGILALGLFIFGTNPDPSAAQSGKDLEFGAFTDVRSSVGEFGELFKLIRSTLSHNKVTFPGRTGPVSGFAAGSAYPQIWLRDASTIIPASRFFYETPFLQSWIEEHLAYQRADGSLEDWIDSRGKADKNTTETDQETSAVRAAAQVTRLAGTAWLGKKIEGATVLSRLERALDSVLRLRFDKAHGLLTGAHTADWGDVDMNAPDQRAIYVDRTTHWTCDIYDQSQFYAAARDLAWMLSAGGQADQAAAWRERAGLIRKNADQWLWQKDKGFFRVHIHLDALKHDFDEEAMFAMGGNTEAMISGLASDDQCRRIIEAALTRQKQFSMSTISGALLPPYPQGFFKHPMMDQPFEYQNGGQWDWFGGKLIAAMFEHGFSRAAREKLIEIARKNIANKGLYEWDSPGGKGQGSAFYSGSAGSLGQALFEGYFGFKIAADSLALEPKPGADRVMAHVFIPAEGAFAAYDYQWDERAGLVTFRYNSNIPARGNIKLLLPWIRDAAAVEELKNIDVRRDGAKLVYQSARVNNDAFLTVETDFKDHTLTIKRGR